MDYQAIAAMGGPATSARVNFPAGVALDSGGNLYFADSQNNRVRKVTLAGTISTVAGNGIAGFSGDGGAATSSELNGPGGVAIDSSGNLYISDSFNQRIRLVTPSGMISTVAGSGPTTIGGGNGSFSGDGGPATSARLNSPDSVALDSSGNLYIADSLNHRIRMVSPIGTISTVAGSGPTGASGGSYGGDGGAATSARLNDPFGVALDASGNLYIADTGNNRVRVVAPLGTSTSGQITTIAGTGTVGFSGDGGMATSAQLSAPTGVAVDGSGNLYIAELNNDRVRGVTPSGVISTLAGNGAYAYNGDGIPATSAAVCDLGSIALDSNGNLYFPDGCNMRVRKVTY